MGYMNGPPPPAFMAHRILRLAGTTHGSRDARAFRARRDYKLASLAAFGRSLRKNDISSLKC